MIWCGHKWTRGETYIENGQVQAHFFSKTMLPYCE